MPSERIVLTAFLVLFVCRATAATLVVPPWHGMDEPQHFALSYNLSLPLHARNVDAEILQSMFANKFWKQWEDEPPNPLPATLETAALGTGLLIQPTYYGLASYVLRVTRPANVAEGLYHLRALSVVLSITALVFGWMGTRLLFGSDIALGGIAVSSLHPQFLLAAITANPDALLFLIGAFLWWQLARIATGIGREFSLTLLIVVAVAALLTKRSGIVIALSSTLAGLAMMTNSWHVTPRGLAAAGGVALIASVPVAIGLVFFQDQLQALMSFWAGTFSLQRRIEDTAIDQGMTYGAMAVDHFWLVAGWVRFSPPDWWLWIARTVMIGAAAGVVVALVRERASVSRRAVLLAGFIVGAHIAAMLFTGFWAVRTAPEARFLFPAYAPLMALACVGLSRLAPATRRREWFMAVLVLLVVLDATAFTHLLIPLYISW